MGTIVADHVGICVTDLDRSLRFWCDGLGFETVQVLELGSEWSEALEIGGNVDFTAHFIRKDGFVFELLYYRHPAPQGAAVTSRNQIGFTHLTVYVDDLDATVEHLIGCGGTVLANTRTRVGDGDEAVELVFVAAPDGVRIEVAQVGG